MISCRPAHTLVRSTGWPTQQTLLALAAPFPKRRLNIAMPPTTRRRCPRVMIDVSEFSLVVTTPSVNRHSTSDPTQKPSAVTRLHIETSHAWPAWRIRQQNRTSALPLEHHKPSRGRGLLALSSTSKSTHSPNTINNGGCLALPLDGGLPVQPWSPRTAALTAALQFRAAGRAR